MLEAVGRLFERIGAAVGSDKVAALYVGTKPELVQQEWAIALSDFSREELERGLRAMRLRRFALNLGEFALLCRPALDPEYAWHEAQDGLQARERGEVGVWSHPAVWRAAKALGYELRNGNFASVKKRWEMVLNREFAAGWGEEVPAPAPRIEHTRAVQAIPPEVKSKLAELAKSFSRKGL